MSMMELCQLACFSYLDQYKGDPEHKLTKD